MSNALNNAVKLAKTFAVTEFGAVGDNATDSRAAIQAAEDACALLGRDVELWFPDGTYCISAAVLKKARVHWRGPGKLRRIDNASPAGTQFALVFADEVDDWTIDGVSFEAIAHDVMIAASLPRANGDTPAAGGWNSCIDAYKCERWAVRQCAFNKFSQGIKYTGSGDFSIERNTITAGTAYTVANMMAGTAHAWSAAGTGAIVASYDENGPVKPNGTYSITGNRISCPGLDQGIEAAQNYYDRAPSVIAFNRVEGTHSGIQSYQGSLGDPETGSTYNLGQIISSNVVTYTWEQGIYIRGLFGVQVLGNYIERAGLTNNDIDASAGGIILRVNPFDSAAAATFVMAADDAVSDDHAILVEGNRVVDPGRDGETISSGIYVRINNAKVRNNQVVRSAENFSTASFPAILVANGGRLRNFDISCNTVHGPFTYGVQVVDVVRACSLANYFGRITGNVLELAGATVGIEANWFAPNVDISGNRVTGATTGVRLRFAPYSQIKENEIRGATTGVLLSEGCLSSDVPYLLSAGSVTRAVRRGGTIDIARNRLFAVTTPYGVESTTADDAAAVGRANVWEGDTVDGKAFFPFAYSGGTPATSGYARTWHQFQETKNTAIASGQPMGRVCVSAGTYGSATTATGTRTSGSPIITAVSSLDGYGPGIYLSLTGFTGPALIVDVDTGASTITVDRNAASSAAGMTLSVAAPTFAAYANLA